MFLDTQKMGNFEAGLDTGTTLSLSVLCSFSDTHRHIVLGDLASVSINMSGKEIMRVNTPHGSRAIASCNGK